MTNTSRTERVEPETPKEGRIYSILKKSNNDEVLESKTRYPGELSVKIDIQYASHSIIIFKLSGNMLQSTITSLRNILHANKQHYTFLIFDMREVRIINSAGWGLFIAEQKNCTEERRTLILTNFQPELQQIFNSLQLHLIIQYFPTLTDCLNIHSEIKTDPLIKPSVRYPLIQNRVIQGLPNVELLSCDLSKDPIQCIHNAIIKYGPCSFFKLLSILQSSENKKLKIGPLRLRSLLKDMELDTFEKRLRYFRSC